MVKILFLNVCIRFIFMIQYVLRKQGVKQMKQIKKTKKQESGRSMIEMVGVLAVMGLITAGAFVLISSAMKSQKTSRLDDDVSAIVAGVRLLYNSADSFADLKSDALEVIGYGTDVKNPYGGKYAVAKGSGTAPQEFYVYVDGLSSGECKALTGRKFPGGGNSVSGGGTVSVTDGVVSVTGNACPSTGTGSVRITYSKVQ